MNCISEQVLDGESPIRRENLISSLTSFSKSKSKIFAFENLVYSERGLWVVPRSKGFFE